MTIKAPNFCKDAVPTSKGWHHAKTGELLKSTRISQADIDDFHDVVVEATVVPAPLMDWPICPTCDENGNCTCDDEIAIDTTNDLESMSKKQLEDFARSEGVELDRRMSKKKLLAQAFSLLKR